jgi:alkanesulfonate monooxygenase SsuD/methylene tetrahydromethanopterin reductase-like flavin-dependent oxidoreductase (luciferase family)
MRRVQLGYCMPTEGPLGARWTTLTSDLDRALELIAGHFDSAWAVDHLQFSDRDVLESFTLLTYMAARHPRLTFGHTVMCHSFRNPALVAKMAATVQCLTGGRFVLGIGAGWHAEEYHAYGYTFPPARTRVEQLDEALQIIKALWVEDQVTFVGRHHQVVNARCAPRPDRPPTVMVGAFRPTMLRLAARRADWWNVSSTGPARYRRITEEFKRACDVVGRDPSTVRRSWVGGCACAPTQEEAERLASGRFSAGDEEDFGFIGTPEQLVEQMRPFVALGVDYFMLDCGGFPNLTALELLVNDVLPALHAQ